MSFPTDPLEMTFEIYLNGAWVDITEHVRITEDIVMTRGKMSPLADTVPATCSLQVDNADGRFVAGNAIGPYAGLLKRNTQLRVRVNPGSGLVTRFSGEVPAWAPRQDISGNNRWVSITARGQMYRIAAGGAATSGALRRYITERQPWALLAYWPCEDGSDATSAASADSDAGPMGVSSGARFGVAAPLSGVKSLLDPSGAFTVGRLRSWYAFEWRIECVGKWDQVPTTTTRILSWITPGGVSRWNLNATVSGIQLQVYTPAVPPGAETLVITINTGFIPVPGDLHHFRVDCTMSGTTMNVAVLVDGVSVGTGSRASTTTLPPTYLRLNPDASSSDDVPSMGHVAIWADRPVSLSYDAARGWMGQEAHARIEAVCETEGISYSPVLGGTVSSEPMGPQPVGNVMQILRDCEATDGGILYELTTGELSYLRRADLYNQPAALALDYSASQVAPPFEPTVDDALLRNDVTARRPSGSESRYVDEDHVAAEGRHEDPISVNPEHDERLPNLAAFAVRKGTTETERYDSLSLNFAHPQQSALLADWLAMDIGSRITVDNAPSHPDLVDVLLVGYRETICPPRTWRVDMVCEPATPHTVGVRGADRRDTSGSELAVATTTGQATDTSATTDYIVIPDVSAGGFSVGNRVVLHDEDGFRKEPTVFTVTSKASAFGFTNVSFSPAARAAPTGVFGGAGDTIRRVDETSLYVATTTGPLWTTTPAQFPFDVRVGGERMTVTAIASALADTFTRTVSGGWGSPWTVSAASQFLTNGTRAAIGVNVTGTVFTATVAGLGVDYDVTVHFVPTAVAAGAQFEQRLRVRSNGTAFYESLVQYQTTGVIDLYLTRSGTSLSSLASHMAYGAGTTVAVRLQVSGSTIRHKIWDASGAEPASWAADVTDTAVVGASTDGIQLAARRIAGNTQTGLAVAFDNVTVTNPQLFTVTRAVNGVEKGHAAGAAVSLWNPARRAL